MKATKLFRFFFLVLAMGLSAAVVQAADLDAVKSRMEQRVGAIDALKTRGVAGENNRGYLEARGGATAEDQKVISDENADRRTVYVALAQQTKTDPETVGTRRAHQIALSARRGVWIQGKNGEWAQKG